MTENINTSDLKTMLSAERDKLKRVHKRISIIAPIVVLIVIGYFNFIYATIKQLVEPTTLAALIEIKIVELVPQVTKSIEQELIASSPQITRRVIDSLIQSAPKARAESENFLLGTTDNLMTQMRSDFSEIVLRSIREHKQGMQELIKDLKDEKKKKELSQAMSIKIKDSLNDDSVKEFLDTHYQVLKNIQEELEHLASSQELTEEQMLKKEIIRTIRSLMYYDLPAI